jgi:putative transposase
VFYEAAKQRNSLRWSRSTRTWAAVETVTLNPDKEDVNEQLYEAWNLKKRVATNLQNCGITSAKKSNF